MNEFDHVQLHYRLHIYNPNDEKAKENLAVSLENWCSHLEKKKPAQLNKFKFDNDKELRTLKVHLKKEKIAEYKNPWTRFSRAFSNTMTRK